MYCSTLHTTHVGIKKLMPLQTHLLLRGQELLVSCICLHGQCKCSSSLRINVRFTEYVLVIALPESLRGEINQPESHAVLVCVAGCTYVCMYVCTVLCTEPTGDPNTTLNSPTSFLIHNTIDLDLLSLFLLFSLFSSLFSSLSSLTNTLIYIPTTCTLVLLGWYTVEP